jgi:hypothetical protein
MNAANPEARIQQRRPSVTPAADVSEWSGYRRHSGGSGCGAFAGKPTDQDRGGRGPAEDPGR